MDMDEVPRITCEKCNGQGKIFEGTREGYDRVLIFRRRVVYKDYKSCKKCCTRGSVDWIENIVGVKHNRFLIPDGWSEADSYYYIFRSHKNSSMVRFFYLKIDKWGSVVKYVWRTESKLYSWWTIFKHRMITREWWDK